MFAVTVAFGSISWRLLYKSEEKANEAFALISAPPDKTVDFNSKTSFVLVDDFGQKAFFHASTVMGGMLENLDESKIGAIEMGLHNKRTEVGFQQRAENDPTVRAAAAGRGPGIIAPMGNGRFS